MENKKRVPILVLIIYIFSVLSLVFMGSQLIINNLLSDKYRYGILGIITLVILIVGFVIYKFRHKKILVYVLSFILMLFAILETLAGAYIFKTFYSYNKKVNETNHNLYSLITLKTNSVNNISEIKTADIYYDVHDNKKEIQDIENQVRTMNNNINFKEGDSSIFLAKKLIKKEIEYMLVNEAKLEILKTSYKEFNDSYKIVELNNGNKIKVTSEKKNIAKSVELGKSFNVFVTGGDSYEGLYSDLRSDVNILLTINPKTREVLMTSIPRDAYVMMRDLGYDKLTHAGIYGIDTLVGTIEDLLNTEINYYIKINFASLEKIVNALGGVTVHNDYEFTSRILGKYYPKGELELDGARALDFSRERYSLPSGDFDRGQNQLKVMEAMFKKALSPSILLNYTSVLDTILEAMNTNIPVNQITQLVNNQIDDNKPWTFNKNQILGDPVMGLDSYSMPDFELSFTSLYEDEIFKAQKLVKDLLDKN